jgi:hypothetical protein
MFIDIVEIEDWHTPSVSSSDCGDSNSGSGGDDYIRPAFSSPWSKRTRLLEPAADQDEGGGPSTRGGATSSSQKRAPSAPEQELVTVTTVDSFLVGSVIVPWKKMPESDVDEGGPPPPKVIMVGPHSSPCTGSVGHGSHAAVAGCLDEAACVLPLHVIGTSLGDRLDPMLCEASVQSLMARHASLDRPHLDFSGSKVVTKDPLTDLVAL